MISKSVFILQIVKILQQQYVKNILYINTEKFL